MDLLKVNDISKTYKGFKLNHISFDLPAGYIMGYIGQNGSGKTTTLNMITGILRTETGSITIEGKSITDDPISYKDSIGYISDTSFFPVDFTIQEVRRTLKDFYPSFNGEKFDEYVKNWSLPEKKKIKDYSKGMKVKLMFADILSRETKILILDEATNGLDPVVKDEILGLMQEYIADGTKSILFSTHILSDLEQIADYIFFIHNGEEVMNDTKDEIIESFLLLKAGPNDLNSSQLDKVIGIKKSSVLIEGLIKSNEAICFNKNVVLEKPTVDQIVIHYIIQKIGGK